MPLCAMQSCFADTESSVAVRVQPLAAKAVVKGIIAVSKLGMGQWNDRWSILTSMQRALCPAFLANELA